MIDAIVKAIRENSSFLITTHEGPDGDAVGSTLALANYLVSLGKDVALYYKDPLPDIYAFLPLSELVKQTIPEREFDVTFVLDVGEFRRAGEAITSFNGRGTLINLDHHLQCDAFGEINLIDPDACATGAIVYRVIKAAGGVIDNAVALCIYTAVITDTGSFRYSNANPEAFSIAGDMVACGVNPWFVSEKLYESQPRERLELLALALATLTVSRLGNYASITVTTDMYEKTGSSAELTDGFINYPRSIRGVEAAVFFRELEPGIYKVGFRSKGKVNVAALAAAFNGGGHHNAAGCTVAGSMDEVREVIFAHLERSF